MKLNETTLCFPRTSRGKAKQDAAESDVALHTYPQPLAQRFFYALLKWGWVAVLAAVFLLTGCDRMASAHAQAVEAVAEQQDREALSSREWAGQQVCGPHATAIWESDKSMYCAKERTGP